jgi:hypothetical protein
VLGSVFADQAMGGYTDMFKRMENTATSVVGNVLGT